MTQVVVPEREQEVDEPVEPGLVLGRPVEDRSFEVVETSVGVVAGVTVGALIGGPFGAVAGGVVGGAAGLAAGEALERHEGAAAKTTDAEDLVAHR
jgi:uncharacterized protein YcfJ